MKRFAPTVALLTAALITTVTSFAQEAPKPLRALLVIGGCCHDYAAQKDILKKGIEARANVTVDLAYSPDTTTKAQFDVYSNPDWANGYDVVIHDECSADVKDVPYVENILKAHKDGVPAVNLHCAMHSYRTGTKIWFEFLGIESARHTKQFPIQITYEDPEHPITKGMSEWTTLGEELYNNIMIWGDIWPLARGKQGKGDQPGTTNAVIAWTRLYGSKKTRVFSTTLGHNNVTIEDPRYLDLVTRGLLWSCNKLKDDGTPQDGYAPGAAPSNGVPPAASSASGQAPAPAPEKTEPSIPATSNPE